MNEMNDAAMIEEAAERARLRRIEKARWKAKTKSVSASQTILAFDPYEVFERDGWQCVECGRGTPIEARGTKADNAPCLHHVVSMSKGGDHVPENCECWCEACSRPKAKERPSYNDFNPAKGWYGRDHGAAHGWDREAALSWAA